MKEAPFPPPLPERLLKDWGKLRLAKYRHASGLFLAEGGKVVKELLASVTEVAAILCTQETWGKYGALLAASSAPCYSLSASQFAKIAQDITPEGVLAVARMPFLRRQEPLADIIGKLGKRVLLLYQVSDPGNLGAILRSALWFGFEMVIIGAGSVDVGNHKVVKTSLGALFHLHIYEGIDFMKLLTLWEAEHPLVALTLTGEETLHEANSEHDGRIALLLGGETQGLPEKLTRGVQRRWRIPGVGKIDSLSLPQAAAIAMYAYTRRG